MLTSVGRIPAVRGQQADLDGAAAERRRADRQVHLALRDLRDRHDLGAASPRLALRRTRIGGICAGRGDERRCRRYEGEDQDGEDETYTGSESDCGGHGGSLRCCSSLRWGAAGRRAGVP
ncbi:hypothetical protein GCM10010478_46810 [Streptomyces erythrogriseus]|uniref:Uncharacterized protein n=1 Tax=Streptomyces erythrogriseus TaxID=284027 RepID=A0ABP6JNJ2_9ACTN